MTTPEEISQIDLVQLSDLAWTVIDPGGRYDGEESLWAAALPRDWPPPRSAEDLQRALAHTVSTIADPANLGRLKLVAALMCFLASHPPPLAFDETLLREAVEEELAAPDGAPTEMQEELAERAARIDAHVRTRATRHGEQHARGHPQAELGTDT